MFAVISIFSSFLISMILNIITPNFSNNGYVRFFIFNLVFFSLLWSIYRLQHFFLRYKMFAKLISFTSLTSYKFWGRYRGMKQRWENDSMICIEHACKGGVVNEGAQCDLIHGLTIMIILTHQKKNIRLKAWIYFSLRWSEETPQEMRNNKKKGALQEQLKENSSTCPLAEVAGSLVWPPRPPNFALCSRCLASGHPSIGGECVAIVVWGDKCDVGGRWTSPNQETGVKLAEITSVF